MLWCWDPEGKQNTSDGFPLLVITVDLGRCKDKLKYMRMCDLKGQLYIYMYLYIYCLLLLLILIYLQIYYSIVLYNRPSQKDIFRKLWFQILALHSFNLAIANTVYSLSSAFSIFFYFRGIIFLFFWISLWIESLTGVGFLYFYLLVRFYVNYKYYLYL